MPALIPSSSNEHVELVRATAPLYFKKESDLTFRRRLWLAMLLKYGQVEYNASSFSQTWTVQFSEPEVRQFGDSGDQEFNQSDSYRQLSVDVRGYTSTDRLTKKQELMNRGPTQIVDMYRQKSENLLKSLRNKFCGELYVDGDLAGNENRVLGIESFMGADGANTLVGDIVAPPTDTYGGLSTTLASEGGAWSVGAATSPNAAIATDWPFGSGDTEYDFLSPKLWNYTSTALQPGGTTWAENCEDVLRKAGVVSANLTDDESVPYCHMIDAQMFTDFLNFQAARNRIVIPHKESEDLGFGKTVQFEGSAVKFEFNVPAGVGYGISPEHMEVFSLDSQLFVPDGPSWSIVKKGWLYEVGYFGNMRFQPKYFSKYADYTSAS